MRKRGLVVIWGIFWIMAAIPVLHAGGYEFCGLGARAVSMGGAFIGLADDWTAIYWNPAGLATLHKRKAGISIGYPIIKFTDKNSIANGTDGPFGFAYPTEPSRFNKEKVRGDDYLIGVGGYQRNNNFTIGAGLYTPNAYAFEWEDRMKDASSNADIYGSYFNKLFILVSNISLSKKLLPELSIGTGLNLVYGSLEIKAKKEYSHPTLPALYNYIFDSNMRGNGMGVEGILGLLFEPGANIRIGGVYRSGSILSLAGSAEIQSPIGTSTTPPPLLISVVEKSDYTQKFVYPATLGMGIAYRINPKLTITGEWVRTYWVDMKEDVDFEIDPGTGTLLLKDVEPKRSNWDNTDRLRIGLEFRANEQWALRIGAFSDPSPVPTKGVDFAKIIDVDKKYISLGVGYERDSWMCDICYLHNCDTETLNGVEYGWGSDTYIIDCQYKF
ncbi:MAG: outer membrane protein transport protein [bacterium]